MIFDSCILLDVLNGNRDARALVATSRAPMVSVLTRAELLAGAADSEQASKARALLALFAEIPIDVGIAERAAVLRRDYRIKLPDALIAATAAQRDSGFYTRDQALARLPGATVPYGVA